MRILHLDSGRDLRGGQIQAALLIKGLLRQGVECTLLCPKRSPLFAQAQQSRWNVQPLGPARLRLSACDLIHAHDARSHSLAAAFGGAPLVVSRRVAFPVGGGALSRWKYSRAAHYIAVSEYVAGCLRAADVPDSKISVVYDGVVIPKRHRILAHRKSSLKTMVISPLSADVLKGNELAAEAAAAAEVPLHLSSNLPSDLSRATIFLYLSKSEGLGSAVLLAMAHGVPVIASRVGGLQEAVQHGITGLLVGEDREAIAEALRTLSSNPAVARRMGEAGRARVKELFSMDQMISGTLEIYKRVLLR
jgi:hypothetical protein